MQSEDLSHCEIRYTKIFDTPYLREWISEPNILENFPCSVGQELDNAIRAWMSFTRIHSSLTATLNGKPIGIGTIFIMPYRKVAHHCQFKLIVDPKCQRKKVGTTLLRNLKHLAQNYFKLEIMLIEVFEGNSITSLLEKEGFIQYARQENYVKEGKKYRARLLYKTYLKKL